MALESATNIRALVATNPTGGDPRSELDDHIRLLKAVLQATPLVIDRAYGEYTTNADISTTIPLDDTIPQNTEGTQIISVSLTPKSTTSRIRLRFQGVVISSTPINVIAAIFSGSSANALASSVTTTANTDFFATVVVEHEYVPGSTSAQTYTVRVGGGGTFRMNGSRSTRLFGGTMKATLVVEEIGV